MAQRTNPPARSAIIALIATPMLLGTASAQSVGSSGTIAPNPQMQSQATQGNGMQAQAPNVTAPDSMGGTMAVPTVSPATVAKAGKAMRNVLAINKSYSAKLSGTTDPAAKSQIVAQAKQKAMSAITDQGLTVGQYNQVLASAEQNPQLRQQLLHGAGVAAN